MLVWDPHPLELILFLPGCTSHNLCHLHWLEVDQQKGCSWCALEVSSFWYPLLEKLSWKFSLVLKEFITSFYTCSFNNCLFDFSFELFGFWKWKSTSKELLGVVWIWICINPPKPLFLWSHMRNFQFGLSLMSSCHWLFLLHQYFQKVNEIYWVIKITWLLYFRKFLIRLPSLNCIMQKDIDFSLDIGFKLS